MASTTFVAKVTHILASWLNQVNTVCFKAVGDGTFPPTVPHDVLVNLGLTATTAPSGASLIGMEPAGTLAATNIQDALTELDTEKAPIDTPTFTGTVTSTGPLIVTYQAADASFPTEFVFGKLFATGKGSIQLDDPAGFTSTAGKFTRLAPAGASPRPVDAALFVETATDVASTSFEWNNLNRLENNANGGENVGLYSQAYKHGDGATWAGVLESHDTTHVQPSAALYGLEIDVSANGDDISTLGFPMRYGIQMVGYRDWGPNTGITGSISGTTLTVTSVNTSGQVTVGQGLHGTGVTSDTVIVALGSGAGGIGTYILNNSMSATSRDFLCTGVIINAKIDDGAGNPGNTLTVTDVVVFPDGSVSGRLFAAPVTMVIYCAGLPAGRVITALGTGTGGIGTYTISGAPALILPDTTTMTINGGATNNISNGLWIGAQFGDPGGSVYTNQIQLAGSGDTGMLLTGYVQVGVACVGHYSTSSFLSITPSEVPIISSVGSMNNALIQFASTDPMHDTGSAGSYNSRIKIIIDGNPFYLHVFDA